MNEKEALINSIAHFVQLDEVEKARVLAHFKTVLLKKEAHFLEIGQVCNQVALLCKGLLMYYFTPEEAEEKAIDFAFEGDWVTYNYSRLSQRPSKIGIKALEPSLLVIIGQADLNDLYVKVPKIERVGRILAENALVAFAQQTEDFQQLNAKARYLKLLELKPRLIERVPQYHIAAYLGINPKSLSRIRHQISRPKGV
ncbi:MAG: Crp/Fnr family transcriptional regulator [Microscillaceae bacterium]|nr:Crp/Fnr family transcriptional regulator [Microscillaceae bacterium]